MSRKPVYLVHVSQVDLWMRCTYRGWRHVQYVARTDARLRDWRFIRLAGGRLRIDYTKLIPSTGTGREVLALALKS